MNAPEQSVYTLLESDPRLRKFMTRLQQCPDLVAKLQDISTDCTVFAPGDDETDPWTGLDGSRDISSLISDLYLPTSALSSFPNVPVRHHSPGLNGLQLLRTRPIWHPGYGPSYSVDFTSRITAADLFARNGVVHILDKAPMPLLDIATTLSALPSASFGILRRAISICDFKLTGDDAVDLRRGGTFFAPTDAAFQSLGEEELRELLQKPSIIRTILLSHWSPNWTLYSNRFYRGADASTTIDAPPGREYPRPRGKRTFELPSAASNGAMIAVEVERIEGLIQMKVNERANILSADHMCTDGVVHVVDQLVTPVETAFIK
ncbi:FAS1 domain-containing protein [Neohortaea acidophila]|uniref:FAS1 domain-containing protein n=1 Tax=Neohortaea acidophila TaxID=245834 RepID=A0A6A6PUX7_9PEZI|nr:FAS1 domain-containing protein [Neohortaea acidophila]KAF2483910.1 FAS1 domain-containing protein [Neohortaea acidophila]